MDDSGGGAVPGKGKEGRPSLPSIPLISALGPCSLVLLGEPLPVPTVLGHTVSASQQPLPSCAGHGCVTSVLVCVLSVHTTQPHTRGMDARRDVRGWVPGSSHTEPPSGLLLRGHGRGGCQGSQQARVPASRADRGGAGRGIGCSGGPWRQRGPCSGALAGLGAGAWWGPGIKPPAAREAICPVFLLFAVSRDRTK